MNEKSARNLIYEVEWRDRKTDPDYQPSEETREEYQKAKAFLEGLALARAEAVPLVQALEKVLEQYEKEPWLLIDRADDRDELLAAFKAYRQGEEG